MRLVPLILVALCAGCSSPRPQAPPRSEATQRALVTVGEVKAKAAAAFVAGSTQALTTITNPPPAVAVAQQMNTRAQSLLPAPETKTALEVAATVSGLTSGQPDAVAKAEAKLAALDALAIEQSEYEAGLRAKLQSELDKERVANALNAGKAGQWDAAQRQKWFERFTDLFGTGGLIALAVAFPALAPLAGRAFGLLSQVMPGSAAITGVVSRASFDGVVAGVERVRQVVRSRNGQQITGELAETIDGLLREERSPADLPLIRERRFRVTKK